MGFNYFKVCGKVIGGNWNKIFFDYLVNVIFYYVRWRKLI